MQPTPPPDVHVDTIETANVTTENVANDHVLIRIVVIAIAAIAVVAMCLVAALVATEKKAPPEMIVGFVSLASGGLGALSAMLASTASRRS